MRSDDKPSCRTRLDGPCRALPIDPQPSFAGVGEAAAVEPALVGRVGVERGVRSHLRADADIDLAPETTKIGVERNEAGCRRERGGRIALEFVPEVRPDPGGDGTKTVVKRPGPAEAGADPSGERTDIRKAYLCGDVAGIVDVDVLVDQLRLRFDEPAAGEPERISCLD